MRQDAHILQQAAFLLLQLTTHSCRSLSCLVCEEHQEESGKSCSDWKRTAMGS